MESTRGKFSKLFEKCQVKIRQIREAYNEYSNDMEFFVLTGFFNAVTGWYLKTRNTKIRVWWDAYRVAVVVMIVLLSWKNITAVGRSKDLLEAMDYIWVYYEAVVITVRYAVIRWHYRSCAEAREFLESRAFGDHETESRKRSYILTRNLTWMFVLANLMMVVPSFMFKIEALQFPFELPNRRINFICHQVYSIIILWFGMTCSFNSMHLYTLISGFETEIQILTRAVETTMSIAVLESELDVPSSNESTYEDQQRAFWSGFNDRLHKCIEQHGRILNNLNVIRPVLNTTYLILYYSTAFNIAGAAFLVMSQLDHIGVYTCQIVALVLVHILECLVVTRMTTHLNDLNESVGDAVYNLAWPEWLCYSERFGREYRLARAQILLVIERCNQGLFSSNGGQFEFTQDKFTELMNSAYSLVTFLWDFRKSG